MLHGATYRKLNDNEPTSEPRYARYTEMVKATDLNRDAQSIIPTFSRISGTGGQLEIRLSDGSVAETKNTYGLDISMAVPQVLPHRNLMLMIILVWNCIRKMDQRILIHIGELL